MSGPEIPENPGTTPEDGAWEFFTGHVLSCAGEIRRSLSMDEDSFTRTAGQAVADARAFVIYTALDEVTKASMWLMRIRDFLRDDVVESKEGVIERLLNESVQEEQHARVRRLLEVLVTLINFETTNEQSYYRHLLALELLDSDVSNEKDMKEFWGCASETARAFIDDQAKYVRQLESQVDLSRCWYLRDRKPLGDVAKLRPGQLLSSSKSRIVNAFPLMMNNERLLFGFSYSAGYGQASESIHYTPEPITRPFSDTNDLSGRGQIGTLGYAILSRCDNLLGSSSDPRIQQIKRVLQQAEGNPLFSYVSSKKIAVGDFVLARNQLAEVLEVTISKYGYQTFRIRYMAERPHPDIEYDSYPAPYVQLFYTRTQFEEHGRRMVEEGMIPADILEKMMSLPGSELRKIMAASIAETWKRGLGEWVKNDLARRAQQQAEKKASR
jgi:hypothetical protein